jgi:hypothetical protein
MLLPVEPTWGAMLSDLQTLSAYAVAYRYPGDSADVMDATDAVDRCRNVRRVIRISLGL